MARILMSSFLISREGIPEYHDDWRDHMTRLVIGQPYPWIKNSNYLPRRTDIFSSSAALQDAGSDDDDDGWIDGLISVGQLLFPMSWLPQLHSITAQNCNYRMSITIVIMIMMVRQMIMNYFHFFWVNVIMFWGTFSRKPKRKGGLQILTILRIPVANFE